MTSLSEFVIPFRGLSREEKIRLVAFVVPLYAANGEFYVTEKETFDHEEENPSAELQSLMQACEKLDHPDARHAILRYLAQNDMCLDASTVGQFADEDGEGRGGWDYRTLKKTEQILVVTQDLVRESEEEEIPTSEISERLEEEGQPKTGVGGSVDSLLNSQFLASSGTNEAGVRLVRLTRKGEERLEKLEQKQFG
ncbi:MAG: hypothetical protein AAF191_11100 [Verrucomicrobiota bacterium]